MSRVHKQTSKNARHQGAHSELLYQTQFIGIVTFFLEVLQPVNWFLQKEKGREGGGREGGREGKRGGGGWGVDNALPCQVKSLIFMKKVN